VLASEQALGGGDYLAGLGALVQDVIDHRAVDLGLIGHVLLGDAGLLQPLLDEPRDVIHSELTLRRYATRTDFVKQNFSSLKN
jgi:hypothetical protein